MSSRWSLGRFGQGLGGRERLVLGLCLAAALVAAWGWAYREVQHAESANLAAVEADLEAKARIQAAGIEAGLSEHGGDVRTLSLTPPPSAIQRAAANGGIDPVSGDSTEVWKDRLTTIFEAMLIAKPEYQQLRMLDVDGTELVRVDSMGGTITRAAEEDLQNKSDSAYLIQALRADAGLVSISALELNREGGVVQMPPVEVIRFSILIENELGEPSAVVIANVLGDPLFYHLAVETGDGAEITQTSWLANSNGQFLLATSDAREFGEQLLAPNPPSSAAGDELSSQIGSGWGVAKVDDQILAFVPVSFEGFFTENRWIVVKQLPASSAQSAVLAGPLAIAGLLLVVALGVTLLLSRALGKARASEARLSAVSGNITEGLVVFDPGGRVIEINEEALGIFRLNREEAVGARLDDEALGLQFLLEDGEISSNAYWRSRSAIEQGSVIRNETFGFRRHESAVVWARANASFIEFDGRGEKGSLLLTLTDVTKELNANRRAEHILSATAGLLVGLDPDRCIQIWNPHAEQLFGTSSEQVKGVPLQHLPLEWESEKVQRAVSECLQSKGQARTEVQYRGVDGKPGSLGLTATWIDGADPELECVISGRDITERLEMETRLLQSQKLESIGQLTAGVAHEINTPTQFVGDNVKFLQDSFVDMINLLSSYGALVKAAEVGPVPPELVADVRRAEEDADVDYLETEIPKAIEQSLDGIRRIAEIVGAMKEFSHPDSGEKVLSDLNKIIESTVTVARNEWKYVSEVETELAENLPPVLLLPGEFSQVMLNLLVNAAHALEDTGSNEKGRIYIRTKEEHGFICIQIEDTGTGIPEGLLSRIVDPFFTTKDVGKGTGQGLAIARNVIVDKHGGDISVESRLGHGTVFTLRIPLEQSEDVAA